MGERGPKASTNIKVLDPPKKRYPNPPPGMTRNARTTWHRIIHGYKRDYFKPQHYDLLRVFCEASASHKKAILEMEKNGQVVFQANGGIKKSPWKDIEVQMASVMTSLSTKLGLNKNSTIASRTKDGSGKSSKTKSKRDGLLGGME